MLDKVRAVVEREFGASIIQKEDEVDEIERRLLAVRKALQIVRYGAVTKLYAASVIKV